MLRRKYLLVILFFFLFSTLSHGQIDADTLFYEITREMIKEAKIMPVSMQEIEHYSIHFQLKKDYHTTFKQLTGNNIDNFLAITHDGEIIAASLPTIKAEIWRGRFSIQFERKEKAEEVLRRILDK